MNRGPIHDLSGLWHVSPMSHELRRIGADPALEHNHWPEVPVPGHWVPHLGEMVTGPLVYRRRFELGENKLESDRYWLQFDGVMSGAEVWFDGRFLGDVVGYFAQHLFEITDDLRATPRHVIAVDVACPPGAGPRIDDRSNTSLTGALQTGPFAATASPGGIWQPVSIRGTGPVAIRHSRVLCTEAKADIARLRIKMTLDAVEATTVEISSIAGLDGKNAATTTTTHPLAAGENRIEWEVVVEQPKLWWPSSLGDQPLYDLTVDVEHEGIHSDGRRWVTGLRQVQMKNFHWSINGRRMFMKSIAYGPSTPFIADEPTERIIGDVRQAHQAGFDMIRIFAHVARPEVYETADRLGVLLWQDLPLIGGYSSKVRRAGKVMIQQAVDKLGHHPSVVAWGGHVLPNGNAVDVPTHEAPTNRTATNNRLVRRLARHVTPTWNRGVLDSIVGRELKQADTTRPVITRSASLPSPTDPGGSDAYLWFGWRVGLASDFPDMVRRWPRLGAFPGGIGSQSMTIADWDLNSPTWPGAETDSFDRYVPRGAYATGEAWARATRAYQADLLEEHVQFLRRLKYKPTGGFCVFALVDSHPDGGFGLLDLDRNPKPAMDRMFEALRPVVVLAEPPPQTVVPGQQIEMPIHVVNDLAVDLGEATVTAEVSTDEMSPERNVVTRRGWADNVPADSCSRVGVLSFEVPEFVGQLTVAVTLKAVHLGMPLNNESTYRTIVIPQSESLSS